MTLADLAARIDHTILKPEAQLSDIEAVVKEAIQYRFASVCVAPIWVTRVSDMLRGTGVACCTVVSFPLGTSRGTVKAFEAANAEKEGATEIDVVACLPWLMNGDVDSSRGELRQVVSAVREAGRQTIVKVIVESALLLQPGAEKGERAIAAACQAVSQAGCDFIKTSTGFHPAGGASVEAVRLMKKHGNGLKIKASGGIRNLETALAMIEAGADRLGLSASVGIMRELEHGGAIAADTSGY